MRTEPWTGLRHDSTDMGEESWGQFNNIQMRIVGELRDRPGLGERYALQADLLTFLETGSVRTLIGFRGGTIRAVDISSGSTYTNKTGLSSTVGCFANCLGAVYYCNGTDPMQVIYNGSLSAQAAGITAAVAAPTAGTPAAGSITAGVHLIRYRYKNSATGYLSNPSPALSFTAAGSQNCPLTLVASADAKVNQIVIEMTQAAGSTYYVVATTTNTTSYTINVNDTTLAQQQLANVYASPDGYGHEPPPSNLIAIIEHRNRLFGIASDGTLYWTRASFPEAWHALNWGKKVFATGGDKPVAMASFYNDLYIFGSRGMARMVYTGDPAAGMLVQLPSAFGAYSQRTVMPAEGSVFGWGRDGIWVISAIQPELMSTKVQTELATVDTAYVSNAHAFFDPSERVAWFMFRATGSTGVKNAVVFDLNTGQWSTRSFRHIIASSCSASNSVGGSYAYLSDSGSYTWRLDDGVWDAVPSTMASGVITAATGSTTSTINTVETLDTAQGLAGAILYNQATGEEILITSNGANSMALSTPLASTPTVGQTYYIGSISNIMESGFIAGKMERDGKRSRFLEINHLSASGSTGVEFKVEYFLDFSTTPYVFTSSPDDQMLSGLGIVNGRNYATSTVDLGVNLVPMPSDYAIVLKWRLTRVKPLGRMRLINAGVQDDTDRKAKEVPY